MSRVNLHPNDADDSSSSTDSDRPYPGRVPKRSATVSPSTKSLRHHPRELRVRRRSACNLYGSALIPPSTARLPPTARRSGTRERSAGYFGETRLRKTNSEPSVEMAELTVSTMKQLVQSLVRPCEDIPSSSSSTEQLLEDEVYTGIEELRDAAKSIQSLQRVLTMMPAVQQTDPSNCFSDDGSSEVNSREARVSGISTRLGSHPRGVMQFLPFIRTDSVTSSEDTYRNRRPLTRKTSAPDNYLHLTYDRERRTVEHKSPRSPYAYSGLEGEEVARTDTPLLEADVLLWNKRSRASLRRHSSVRNMAARELFDTEKSFVEGLEYLVQKYMRPLRQPLEATLIEAGLLDKIFYRIPEILAHHQVLLANLSSRMETWHKDTMMGDLLLAHFSKQSMIDTYISFVDNFQYAKAAIAQARTKPSFDKYYNRCCRDHRNKLDLDSMLISPIQRVPRYELIIKQMLKHTPVYHPDHERLVRAQKHVHHLAMSINRHRHAKEQAEQRLMEIEAIVDGLDDLVAAGRSFIRYDVVNVRSGETRRQRVIFTFTDQILLTAVKRRNTGTRNNKIIIPEADYLDANRFQLLIKISLDDVSIAKDTLSMLRETEGTIEEVKEDMKVLKKMTELAQLLGADKEKLVQALTEMESDNSSRLRSLNDQLSSNPDLTTVLLNVSTLSGLQTVPIEFGSADKRAAWESVLKESKNARMTGGAEGSQYELKSILPHQSRPGLHFCAASVVPSKRPDSLPFVWACTSDRFQGQVAVVNIEGPEPTIESCAGIGNSAITAICTVNAPSKAYSRKRRRMERLTVKEDHIVDIASGSGSSDSDDDESSMGGQATVWIGNEDGEVFVLNSNERVRTRPRERVAKLHLPVDAIVGMGSSVFVSVSRSSSDMRILVFRPNSESSWDLDRPSPLPIDLCDPVRTMAVAGRRLAVASGPRLILIHPSTLVIERSLFVLSAYPSMHVSPPPPCPRSDSLSTATSSSSSISSTLASAKSPSDTFLQYLAVSGSLIFVCTNRSQTVHVIDAFTLERLSQFSIQPAIQSHLTGRQDIIREHKLGCLRVSSLVGAGNELWIGTSAGATLHVPVSAVRSNPQPTFTVCDIGHAGPCRVLLPIPLSPPTRRRAKCSMSVLVQSAQMVLSLGEGLDDVTGTSQDGSMDTVNHLLFWRLLQ